MKEVTTKSHELDLNTGIMSWMRLGQVYDLQGRRSAAMTGKESRGYVTRSYKRQAPADITPEAKN